MYMPSLCGLWAGEIDQQCRVLLHVSRKAGYRMPWAHTRVRVRACMPVGVGVGCDARKTGTRSQTKHTQLARRLQVLTLYKHICIRAHLRPG